MPNFSAAFGSFQRELLVDTPGEGLGDGHHLALALDLHLPPLMHLDGVDLGRPFVERPQIAVDADLGDQAFLVDLEGADRPRRRCRVEFRIRRVAGRDLDGRPSGGASATNRSAKSRTAISAHNDRRPPSLRRPCPAGTSRRARYRRHRWRRLPARSTAECSWTRCVPERWLVTFHDRLRAGVLHRSPIGRSARSRTEAREPAERTARKRHARERLIRRCALVANRHGSMIRPPKAPHEPE